MRNNEYNLVVLHHKEVFETRELALEYLDGFYKPYSLDAEPIVVKYGDVNNPDVILAFGTSDTAPGGYYAIDMRKTIEKIDEIEENIDGSKEELEYVADILDGVVKASGLTIDENKIEDKVSYEPDTRDEVIGSAVTIAEAIDLLSKYTQSGLSDNKLTFEETNSIKLTNTDNPNGGTTLKADVKISSDGDTDDLIFNDNIIGIKPDGIYAAAKLFYDDARHQLIFTTSGYKNGRFQDDAIVQRIDLGEHTKLVADNDGKTVKINISENESNNTTILNADLQISDRENNILKSSDGKVYVDGTARNIKYNDSTVADTLTSHKDSLDDLAVNIENAAKSAHVEGNQTDTIETLVSVLADGGARVTGNVRLGSNNSIVVRNGGLEANITVDVDNATNKLIVTIGNQTIIKTLPGIELFESAEYNDENEELIITFRTGKTLVVPIHDIIHTWKTSNSENSPITLTKTVVTGGVDTLSADIKLRSTNNLIGIENGNLYVSEANIDDKISAETVRATNAERELRGNIETLQNNLNEVRTVANHADEIALEAKDNITSLNNTVNEHSAILTTHETSIENLTENVAEIAVLRNTLTEEVRNRTNKDTELATAIVNETTRATAAESANSARIDELEDAIGSGSSQILAEAKEYTDSKVASEKTERETKDTELEGRIERAISDASDDATAKANAAEQAANTYADNVVTAEKGRAEAAEQANADAITTLTTEVDKKVESVEIVKNSESDLQYILKVDGVDAGVINIPKDQHLKSVELVSQRPAEEGESEPVSGQFLKFTYVLNDGTEKDVYVDVSAFLAESEFGDGLEVSNAGVVSAKLGNGIEFGSETTGNKSLNIKIDKTSDAEGFLSVGTNGVKISGVQDAIDAKVAALDVTNDAAVAGQYVAAIEETDGIVAVKTRANVSEAVLTNYAKGSDELPIAATDTINQAFSKIEVSIVNNEQTTAAALNELNDDLTAEVTRAQAAEAAIDTAVGLTKASDSETRTFTPTTKYGTGSTTVMDNMQKLDTQVNENAEDIAELQEDNENIKLTLTDIEQGLEVKIPEFEGGIADLTRRVADIEAELSTLRTTVNEFDRRITEADGKAQEALDAIAGLGDITNIQTRLGNIEDTLSKLIDFGEYDTQL